MADKQRFPVIDLATDLQSGNGSNGVFICSSTSAFDYSALTGVNINKIGYAFVLYTQDGTNAVISTLTTNGAIGDTTSLVSATGWPSGFGQGIEVEKMTVASGTYGFIYLKDIPG